MIYHIISRQDWDRARAMRVYMGDTLANQGFIHCSGRHQIMRVANSVYKGKTGLLMLCIEEERVKSPIRHENLDGGSDLFPHIYGPLNIDAVVKVLDMPPGVDGGFQPPVGF